MLSNETSLIFRPSITVTLHYSVLAWLLLLIRLHLLFLLLEIVYHISKPTKLPLDEVLVSQVLRNLWLRLLANPLVNLVERLDLLLFDISHKVLESSVYSWRSILYYKLLLATCSLLQH